MKVRGSLRNEILKLACLASGVATSDVPGYSIRQVGKSIGFMLKRGVLHKARIHARHVRYFTKLDDALAYAIAMQREAGVEVEGELIANWGPDEPVLYAADCKHTVYPPSRMGEFVTNTHKDW